MSALRPKRPHYGDIGWEFWPSSSTLSCQLVAAKQKRTLLIHSLPPDFPSQIRRIAVFGHEPEKSDVISAESFFRRASVVAVQYKRELISRLGS